MGLLAHVGEGHFPSCCRGRYRLFCRWCHTQVVSAWVGCSCCGWFGVPRCCFGCVACVGRHLRRLSGKWVQPQSSGVPIFWSASTETMSAKGVVFQLCVFGSLLEDGIYCHAFEGGRASRQDDVTFQSSSCHHHRRVVNSVSGWGRQQHRGSVASFCGLPEGDW